MPTYSTYQHKQNITESPVPQDSVNNLSHSVNFEAIFNKIY